MNSTSSERRVIAILLGLLMAQSLALVALWLLRSGGTPADEEAIRDAAVTELISRSSGTWDAYLDADVGRVLLPNLDGQLFRGKAVNSNRYGMRERPYAIPKRGDRLRVVLLGDSYVFGYGADQDVRLGVHLERFLRTNASSGPKAIEVLHLAASSWNIRAEASYLRRQIGDLQPDLVVMIAFKNDLTDVNGVRGFGEMSAFSAQVRSRGEAIMAPRSPPAYGDGETAQNYLMYALDWESRHRFEAAGDDIRLLADALARYEVPFLLVVHWHELNELAGGYLGSGLRPEQLLYVPNEFAKDPRVWNADDDRHWNALGHELVAKWLYAEIVERGLLPQLGLAPWDDAVQVRRRFARDVLAEVGVPVELELEKVRNFLTSPPADQAMMGQVYYGYRSSGRMHAYSSALLARGNGRSLHLEGRSLGRAELEEARARVFVEEFEVGGFPLGSTATFPYSFPLPAEVLAREFVTVRIECDDFVYEGVKNGESAAFVLQRLELR